VSFPNLALASSHNSVSVSPYFYLNLDLNLNLFALYLSLRSSPYLSLFLSSPAYISRSVIIGHSLTLSTPSICLNLFFTVLPISAKLVPFMRRTISYFPFVQSQ
jgi:hypothetical protein